MALLELRFVEDELRADHCFCGFRVVWREQPCSGLLRSKGNTIFVSDVINSTILAANQQVRFSVGIEVANRRTGSMPRDIASREIADLFQDNFAAASLAIAKPRCVF